MRILLHKRVKKSFKKLSSGEKRKFRARRDLFLEDPFHPLLRNHALKEKYEGYRSIDITGDLRALYELIDDKTAYFVYLDTHSNLY